MEREKIIPTKELIEKARDVVNFGFDKNTDRKNTQQPQELQELLKKFQEQLPLTLKNDTYDQKELYNLARDIFIEQIKEGL